jgi:hypothetical protein
MKVWISDTMWRRTDHECSISYMYILFKLNLDYW